MVKLTKNVHKMVQNRPKSSFLRGVSPLFMPYLGGGVKIQYSRSFRSCISTVKCFNGG